MVRIWRGLSFCVLLVGANVAARPDKEIPKPDPGKPTEATAPPGETPKQDPGKPNDPPKQIPDPGKPNDSPKEVPKPYPDKPGSPTSKPDPRTKPPGGSKPPPPPRPLEPATAPPRVATITTGTSWDFEFGMNGWTATGNAFANQPTAGDNVVAERVRTDMTLGAGGIGGDYWKRVPYPIGHHADHWVGTYENHRVAEAPLGGIQGEGPTGTLTSAEFPLDANHRFISFEIGGGNDLATERVELQVRGNSATDIADLERLAAQLRALAAGPGGAITGSGNAFGGVDGKFVIVLAATGRRSEVMRQVVFEVPAAIFGRAGRSGRIRVVDSSSNAWGHINVDDFRFAAASPAPRTSRVWGFADTHCHPMNDLAFGGGVIQGSLYARDGSTFGTDAFRSAALYPLFDKLNWGALGATVGAIGRVTTLLSPFFAWTTTTFGMPFIPPFPLDPVSGAAAAVTAKGATVLMRSGYPNMRAYPSTGMMVGQTVYGEWIRRSYDGGLRLMSALAVNTWVVSAHPVKRAVIGTTAPEDDKGSGDVQVADIKTWALRPENRGWVEVALTPMDARRIIGANKLAIIIGLELDTLGNFVPNDHWQHDAVNIGPMDLNEQRRRIAEELDRLYEQGVRQIGPFHYVSGVFGGAAMFQRMFNDVNRGITGENVQVASGDAQGIRYRLDMDAWSFPGPLARAAITGDTDDHHSHPSWARTGRGHINSMPITPAGRIMFEELARRGMIIDLDHAGFNTTNDLLDLARANRYPVMSSHTDYMELGFTGPGTYTHGAQTDNDVQNAQLFDTTTQGPLRHEGLASRSKIETIANLRGVTGAILWLPRRMSWGNAVPNDNDGSSKTWAQSYQYAVEVMGGHGVALSTDRITLGPRFGPNSAYLLGQEHITLPLRDERRFAQVDAQRNGVTYDVPIIEWRAFRFGSGAWQKTPKSGTWETKPLAHEDAWKAIAAYTAQRNPRTPPRYAVPTVSGDPRMVTNHGIDISNDPSRPDRIINYAWGLGSSGEADIEAYCNGVCDNDTLAERYAAFCVRRGAACVIPARRRGLPGLEDNIRWFTTVWNQWHRMTGTNNPLHRLVFGNRDYDVNIDGVAHYGMIPDFLQDVANSHSRHDEVGTYFTPLFSSAEDYIQMWERAWIVAGRTR